MSLFIPSILLAVLSTITQPLEANNQGLRLSPRPKPGKEPASWQQPLSAVPLFGRFPKLKNLIGYSSFATLPTPLESDQNLANLLQIETLLIKRDDLAGPLASGNKLRKLEFLLGAAPTKQANHIVTWSSQDSCHAALTAICCKKIGMPCTCMYVATKEPGIPAPQPSIPKQYNAKEFTYRGNG